MKMKSAETTMSGSRISVLHVIPSLSPSQGGPSVALPIIERTLTSLGVSVETATTDDDGTDRHLAKRLAQPEIENGVTRWYFPKQIEFYKVSLPLARWLRREAQRFDVVHIHALFSFSSVMAARAARRARVPYVIRPLGVLNHYGMTQRRALLKRVSFRNIEASLLRDAAAVHFTSHDERVEAERLGVPMRSAVIPLGIETPPIGNAEDFLKSYPALRSKQKLLFLSRIDPKKNLEGLFRSLALLATTFRDLAVIIAGSGDDNYVVSLKQLARELNVQELITWIGRVDGPEKSAVLAAADLFVLPSFSENFGIAAIEALAAGLPCVLGHGVAVAAEVESSGAGVAVAPTPEAIADGIKYLLQEDIRQLAAAQARFLVNDKYSSNQMGAGLLRLYREIVGKQRIYSPSSRLGGELNDVQSDLEQPSLTSTANHNSQ
jgi:glycosyltransferase involved in cell wall biosynthesis